MVIAVVVSLVFINLIPLQSVMLKQEILAEKEKMRNLWNLNVLSDNKKGKDEKFVKLKHSVRQQKRKRWEICET